MAPETRYARNGDVTLAWSATAPRDLDLVLVLGGMTHVESLWEEPGMAAWLRRLAEMGRLILYDRRGMGLSDGVDRPITLEDEVADLEAVLDAAGSARGVVFGYSSGGPAALAFAAARPERVQALVLYAAMVTLEQGAGGRRAFFERAVETWGTGDDIARIAPTRRDDAALRAWLARMQRLTLRPGEVVRYAEQTAGQDARPLLGDVRVPTLVLHRREDRVIDFAHGRRIADGVPGARLVELGGEDHLPAAGPGVSAVLGEMEEFLTGGRRQAIARELLTVLFTDVVGATGHAARLGDARWAELLGAHDAAVRRELDRHGGRLVKTTGDGVLATFAGPPSEAVRCAEAVLDAVAPLGLTLRAGLHTGECELLGEDVGGMAVHLAARVCERAQGGQVLASGTTYGTVVGSGLRFADLGPQELRGVPHRWPVFALER